jgi:HSP20 family molecular chaperone IbpA
MPMSNVAIRPSTDLFSDLFGVSLKEDMKKEMERMQISMDDAMRKARAEMFSLHRLDGPRVLNDRGTDDLAAISSGIVKLNDTNIDEFIDKMNKDRLKFNFDVNEFESESISVKTVGNQIEVHGIKKSKKGEEETSEEFSRSYEMPTQAALDPSTVSSSIFKDGILTVELPYDAKATDKTN